MTRRAPIKPRLLQRAGTASPVLLLGVVSVAVVSLLIVSCLMLRGEVAPVGRSGGADARPGDRPLRVYCAAGLREPTETILRQYTDAYGVKTELHTNGSGALFGQIRAESGQGGGPDLYITAEESWALQGQELGLLNDVLPIGTQRPVLIVQPGNPKAIGSLRDLVAAERGVAFGIANEGAAIGVKTRLVAGALGIRDRIEAMRKAEQETVVALASAVALRSLDAAVVWDTTAYLTPGVEVVPLDPEEAMAFELGISRVSVCITASCDRPAAALELARFLSAADNGLRVYAGVGIAIQPAPIRLHEAGPGRSD